MERKMVTKNDSFRIKSNEIKQLIPNMGYCYASNKITIDGLKIGYMYREETDDDYDSGWRFFSGTEDEEYLNNPENIRIYDVNTIANYDEAIIPYLCYPVGMEIERIKDSDEFRLLKTI